MFRTIRPQARRKTPGQRFWLSWRKMFRGLWS